MKAANKTEDSFNRVKADGSKGDVRERDTVSGTSSDIERKNYVVKAKDSNVKKQKGKGGTSSDGKGGRKQGFVKTRMLKAFAKKKEEDSQTNVSQTVKEAVKGRALLLLKKSVTTVLPAFLGLFAVVALVGTIVVAVLAVIYNSQIGRASCRERVF